MKRTLRYGLLAGASGLALGIALTGTSALAFDEVDWTWNSEINTDFTIDPEIVWAVDPEGLVMVESIQIQVGDVDATSTVSGVRNHQPESDGTASGTFTYESEIFLDTELDDDLEYADGIYGGSTSGNVANIDEGANTETTFGSSGGDPDVGDLDSGVASADGAFDGADISVKGGTTLSGGSCHNEGGQGEVGCVVMTVSVDDLQLEPLAALNAVTQLPEVVSVATAVANNLSVTANAGTLMHNGQYAFGEFNSPDGEGGIEYDGGEFDAHWHAWLKGDLDGNVWSGDIDGDLYGGAYGHASGSGPSWSISEDIVAAGLAAGAISEVDTGNRHHDVLATATILAALGLIEQGDVTADSDVSDILNSSVDSNATAVSNNISVSVNPGEEVEDPETGVVTVNSGNAIDNLLVADYTQFSYMNVESTSTVDNVGVNNYLNLGNLDRPLVNSTATSVGNNISVNVGN